MRKQSATQFVWNNNKNGAGNHDELINELLAAADRFDCAIAFMKVSGLDAIKETLVERLSDSGNPLKACFIIGLSMYVTDPAALVDLLELKKKYGFQAYVCKRNKAAFHPKIYQFATGRKTQALIGSANLTAGGLGGNHEASVLFKWLDGMGKPPIEQYLESLKKEKLLEELTKDVIADYRVDHAIDARAKAEANARAAELRKRKKLVKPSEVDAGIFALRQALGELRSMKADGFRQQINRRYSSYKKARRVLGQISHAGNLTRVGFLDLYDKLVGNREIYGYWHSAGLSRGKTTIAKYTGRYQRMLQALLAAQGSGKAQALEAAFKLAESIPRAGWNAISEVLHTIDNTQFAVMNQNSSTALRMVGHKGLPSKPTKKNTGVDDYLTFCDEARDLQKQLKLDDLTQLDVVCNHYYQQLKLAADDL